MRIRQNHRRQGIPLRDPVLVYMWLLVVLILIAGIIVFLFTS